MVEIADREALERWLKRQAREVAIAIAARAALRVVPLLAGVVDEEAESLRAATLLPVFRATATPRVAALGPARGAEVARAAEAAADAAFAANAAFAADARAADARAADAGFRAAHAATRGALVAARAAAARDAAARGAEAADAVRAAAAGRGTAGAFAADLAPAAALTADATGLEQGRSVEQVVAAPLWPKDPPERIARAWSALKSHLLAADEGWEVWTDWYEDCLHGRPFDKALEEARVLIDDALWEQGPKVVNAEIKRLIEEHRPASLREPTLPVERPTPIRFEFRNGILHRAAPPPPHPPEDRRSAAERGWQANRALLDDFLAAGGGRQNPRLVTVLTRCREAIGVAFDSLDVILLGVHHARMQGFAKRADEVLMPEDAAELLAINMQLGLFLGQFPEWADYASGLSDGFGSAEAEQQAVEEAKGALGEIGQEAPSLIAPDAREGLDQLAEAATPEPSPDEPEPVAPPVERRSFLRGFRSFVRTLAEEALAGVQRGVGTSSHTLTVAAFSGAGLYLARLADLLPGEFGWLSSVITYLGRVLGL